MNVNVVCLVFDCVCASVVDVACTVVDSSDVGTMIVVGCGNLVVFVVDVVEVRDVTLLVESEDANEFVVLTVDVSVTGSVVSMFNVVFSVVVVGDFDVDPTVVRVFLSVVGVIFSVVNVVVSGRGVVVEKVNVVVDSVGDSDVAVAAVVVVVLVFKAFDWVLKNSVLKSRSVVEDDSAVVKVEDSVELLIP